MQHTSFARQKLVSRSKSQNFVSQQSFRRKVRRVIESINRDS